MKLTRPLFLAFVCMVPLLAAAQWQWIDKDGRKVFSDRPPPSDIAPNRILKQPGQRAVRRALHSITNAWMRPVGTLTS